MKNIAVLYDADMTNAIEFLSGVNSHIAGLGIYKILPISHSQFQIIEHLINGKQISGVIGFFVGNKWAERLSSYNIPCVNVGFSSKIESIPSVIPDFEKIGCFVAKYFIDNGLKNFISLYEGVSYSSILTNKGFFEYLDRENFSVNVFDTDISSMRGVVKAVDYVEKTKIEGQPFACLCSTDYIARHLIQKAQERGIQIPRELAVFGVGDSIVQHALCSIPLSSIGLPYKKMGEKAFECIIKMLNGESDICTEFVTTDKISIRESSQTYPSASDIAIKTRNYLLSNLFTQFNIDDIASQLKVSKRTVELHYKEAFGITPAKDRKIKRHWEICRLLKETDIPLKELAEMSGYSDIAGFWNAFKLMENKTPSEYREGV